MGDTKTHRAIANQIIARLKAAAPDNNYAFFELGNWLTDVSQFRDPPAFTAAKSAIWETLSSGTTVISGLAHHVVHADSYLDRLMGIPPKDGDLALFCGELAFTVTVERFRRMAIPVDVLKRVFREHYTQYFPHEHLDFPPWPKGSFPGDRRISDQPVHHCSSTPPPGRRRILRYLEEQITILSLLLTVVEDRWAHAAEKDVISRHIILMRYGHASHAIEDFFFHSNFAELAWAMAQGEGLPGNADTHQRRLYYRRRLAPMRGGQAEESRCVYTGFFGPNDVFHTLLDALMVLRDELSESPWTQDMGSLRNTLLELLDAITETDEAKQEEKLLKLRQFVAGSDFQMALDAAVGVGALHEDSSKSLTRAVALDTALVKIFPKVSTKKQKIPLGIFGFIQQLAARAKKAEDESTKMSASLDERTIIKDRRQTNGSTSEDVGSHTLMAKDSVRKEPLRQQAVNLATYVALYVAQIMVGRVRPSNQNGDAFDQTAAAVDWWQLLQHFLAHPAECEGRWWKAAISGQKGDALHKLSMIGHQELQVRLRNEPRRRKALQEQYDRIADDAEREWRSTVGPAVRR